MPIPHTFTAQAREEEARHRRYMQSARLHSAEAQGFGFSGQVGGFLGWAWLAMLLVLRARAMPIAPSLPAWTPPHALVKRGMTSCACMVGHSYVSHRAELPMHRFLSPLLHGPAECPEVPDDPEQGGPMSRPGQGGDVAGRCACCSP